MRTLITWLPFFIALGLLFFRSTASVFLNLYIPILLILPQSFYAVTSGFPKLNFSETTIIAIFLFFVFKEGVRWKPSLTDFFIIFFILSKFISIYLNADLHSAINRFAVMLTDNFAPYVLAKGLIYEKNLNVDFARRFVMCLFINVLISFFEAVTSINPHSDLLSVLFFPGNPSIPLTRYGMTRIVGPFGVALFYGIAICLAIVLNYWLVRNRYWKPNFSRLPVLIFSKGTIITIVLTIGIILNLSRGPWLACILTLILMGTAFSKKPLSSFFVRSLIIGGTLITMYTAYSYYTEIAGEFVTTEEANAAYRFKLIDVYLSVAWERPWFGWDVLPTKGPNLSVDNQYLYLFLTNGLFALIFYLCAMIWVTVRLFFRGLKTRYSYPKDSNLALALMSFLFALILSFFTVYMGEQIEPIFFLFLGWGEGLLVHKPRAEITTPSAQKR